VAGTRHVNVWTSTRNGQAYFQLVEKNGAVSGSSRPYSNLGNARRAARAQYPGVELRNVAQKDRNS
jgi:hypothetical protein